MVFSLYNNYIDIWGLALFHNFVFLLPSIVVFFTDYSCCILKTWQLGKLSILSALKGYVASPCLYTVTSGMHIAENGNYFIIGKIAGFQPTIGEFTRKIHLTCLRTVEQNREGKLFCPYCNSKNLMEIQSEEHIVSHESYVKYKDKCY